MIKMSYDKYQLEAIEEFEAQRKAVEREKRRKK